MTATEFLKMRNIVAKDKTDLIIGFDNGTKESLIELLDSYHDLKLKKLRVGDVSGRSEQLKAFAKHYNEQHYEEISETFIDDYVKSL